MRTFLLPEKFEKSTLVSSGQNGLATLAAWSEHKNIFLLAKFDSTSTSLDLSYKRTALEFNDLYAADFNSDGASDIMFVNSKDKSISFVLDLAPDSLNVTNTIKLPFEPEQILICDFNNDKRLDVLVYARKIPGILPLIGNGKGRFSPGKIIAQDNAVGTACFAQINNDNLMDLIIWDWVKNDIHILYGVGKGRFIDQSVFTVQGEVASIAVASIVRGHPLDLILKMSTPLEFQIWQGSDFGDFQLKSHITIEENASDFVFVDVNNDGLNDVVFTNKKNTSLEVVFNDDADPFSDRIKYSAGEEPENIQFFSQCIDCPKNCIIFDRSGKQLILYKNVGGSGQMSDSIQLIAGMSPSEIITNDFNRDGVADIALINTKSRSVFFYWGRKSSFPFGPFSNSLTEKPRHIAYHSSTDTTLQLVFSFPQSHQISYFTLDASNNSVSNAFIGIEGDGELITSTLNNRNKAEFVTFNTTASAGSSLGFYEQLGSTTFIERTFRLLPPDYLLGASIADLNRDGFPGIVYAYRSGDTSIVELGVAFGDSAYSMKKRIVSKELALPDVKRVFIWLTDFDRDSVLDVLVHAGPPVNNLMVAQGKGDGSFYNPKILTSGFPIEERSNVQIVDVDSDGNTDIVVGSKNLGRVLWFRNHGNYDFDNEYTLKIEADLSHYVIADFNGDRINDLAMTIQKAGFLKIFNGKQLDLHSASIAR